MIEIVTRGVALTGSRDGKIIESETGETVWCPPDIDHWHGATPQAPDPPSRHRQQV